MKLLGKLWRLVMDDPLLGLGVLAWCATATLGAPYVAPMLRGPLLLAGLLAALAASLWRAK